MYNNFKSYILDKKNGIIRNIQNTSLASFVASVLPIGLLDKLAFLSLVLMLFAFAFLSSGLIGLFAFVFMILAAIRLFCYKDEYLQITPLDVLIIIFYLLSIVSLMGSSEFLLSFKGFLKVFMYISFYFCFSYWIRENRNAIFKIFAIISALVLFESIIAIFQNYMGVEAISGWQDMSSINQEDVISRAYGTLKPYNPNLLAGFLVAGLGSLSYFFTTFLEEKKYKQFIILSAILAIVALAIFYTGCRGGYIALLTFILCGLYYFNYYTNKYYGGFKNLGKNVKNSIYALLVSAFAFILLNPAIYKRILSIFSFREDSSISFRMNVYKSCFQMFLGNPFIGIGLGNANFREIYGLYMLTGFDALSAYNIFLETACEMGIFGLISFILILVYAIYIAIGYFKRADDLKEKLLVFSILVFILVIMSHGLVDTIFYRPQVQTLFWTMLAILNTTVFKEPQNP